MTTEKILSTNVRFPKEELPSSINTEDLPNWIQENEIIYNDETKKYTIKRLNGVSAGAANTPVYMDADGQPQPITGFSSSLLDYVDTELDLTRRIKNSQVKVFAEESPFIEVKESLDEQEIRNYEIKESLSDFIAYNEQQGVSILNNFILNKVSDSLSLSVGKGLLTNSAGQLVIGKYNILKNSPFIIGNGENGGNRSNLFEVKLNGDVVVTGKIINGEGIEKWTIYEGNESPSEDSRAIFWISD